MKQVAWITLEKKSSVFQVALSFSNTMPFGFRILFHEKQKNQAQIKAKHREFYGDMMEKSSYA